MPTYSCDRCRDTQEAHAIWCDLDVCVSGSYCGWSGECPQDPTLGVDFSNPDSLVVKRFWHEDETNHWLVEDPA